MNISSEHIASKKKVGHLGTRPVIEVSTTGGLHLVVTMKNGALETLGTGPHRAVARYIAEKQARNSKEEIQWTDLSKADHIPPEFFADILPQYEELTERMRSVSKR